MPTPTPTSSLVERHKVNWGWAMQDDDDAGISEPQVSTPRSSDFCSEPPSPTKQIQRIQTLQPHSHSTTWTIIVEAVMLTTIPGTGPSCTRPIYASPTAMATGLLPATSCDFDEVLHMFAGTRSNFSLVLRVVGVSHQAVQLFVHEAGIRSGFVGRLHVQAASIIPIEGVAHVLDLPETIVQDEGIRRLQIFDQERRLFFTKEWQVEVGILNEDAISWLHDSHYPLEGIQGSELLSRKGSIMPEIQAPQKFYALVGEEFRSRTDSISGSFVNVDEQLSGLAQSRSVSRSDSVITLPSPVEDSTSRPGKTVDLIQQLGFWLYGTRVGQMMAPDPRENGKSLYTQSPLWLLGAEYRNDQWGTGWPCIVSLGPVRRLISLKRVGECEDWSGSGYGLREVLLMTPFDTEIVVSHLVSWLESNDFTVECTIEEGEREGVSRMSATNGNFLQFTLTARRLDDKRHEVECIIKAMSTEHALSARTIFVDILSQVMAFCAEVSRSNTAIEFVYLSAYGSAIEVGPQPNSLVQLKPSLGGDDVGSQDGTRKWKVLLWSEHIHDWIARTITSSSSSILTIGSPESNVDSLVLDLNCAAIYFFADSSLRFALSHSTQTWLCFRAMTPTDFTDMLAWLPSLLRQGKSEEEGQGEPLTTIERTSSPIVLGPRPKTLKGNNPNQQRTIPKQRHLSIGGMEDFLAAFEGCFWFTYRRDLPRLAPSILSSDAGFGCMLRAGQSMMAESLSIIIYGRNRKLDEMLDEPERVEQYKSIISLFLDVSDPAAAFSVHCLTRIGVAMGTPIGQHFCPSVLARALRKQCRTRPDIPFEIFLIKHGVISLPALKQAVQGKAQIVLMSLRLGAEMLNPDYGMLIKAALMSPQTVGIIGGRSARAFYIIGYQDESLLYLDPHLLRPVNTDLERIIARREYHTRAVCEVSLAQLEPTVLFGFLCRTEEDVSTLAKDLSSVPLPMPLFSIIKD